MNKQTRLVEVRQKVLKQNDVVARALRQRFHDAGIFVVSLVSSPGSGKTAFLERVLTTMRRDHRIAALVGDLATDNDANRLARSQAPVKQITTGTVCHLEAEMVRSALDDDSFPSSGRPGEGKGGGSPQSLNPHPNPPPEYWKREPWDLKALDFLFIENVGNLVCPSSYDLGEDLRLVLMSVTEGEDKPLKYPTIFNTADVAVITKMDLAAAVEFDAPLAYQNIQAVRPGIEVIEVSAKSGEGMQTFMDFLRSRKTDARQDYGLQTDAAGLPAAAG